MSGQAAELVRGSGGLESVRAEWEALFERTPTASPFLSPEWMITWQATLANGTEPVLLCARSAGDLVGLLPLSERIVRTALGRVRALSFLGEATVAADGLDMLADPACARSAASTILARLADEPFDLLAMEGLPGDSSTLQLLAWHLGNGGRGTYTLLPHQICPYLDLTDGWEAVLARSRRPNQFTRLYRDLSRMDGFALRTVTQPAEAEAALERLFALHDKRWAVQGGSDAMSRPATREFHRRLVKAFAARGMVRFEELWVEGECRATYYGYERAGHYWLYQTGYDPGWAKKSVAFVRMGLSIKEAAERGITFYDFLRGIETYKFDWAGAARVNLTVKSVGTRRAARLLAAKQQLRVATEVAAEALFPKRSLDVLRRWRRSRQRRESPTLTLAQSAREEAPTLTLPQRGREKRGEVAS